MKKTWQIRESQVWETNTISIGRAIALYSKLNGLHTASNKEDCVRLHMGIRGDYSFKCHQINGGWDLIGGHHNLLYSDGLDLEVRNKSLEIETFGVNFPKSTFLSLISDEDRVLNDFRTMVCKGQACIASQKWGSINIPIQNVVDEIIHNPYQGSIQKVFLFGKSLELLALCIAQYTSDKKRFGHLKNRADEEAIIAARDYINVNIQSPPGIYELSRKVGINEFKLKYGFKEMFGNSVFAYILERRLELATRLLKDSRKSIAVISEELGYSSPQHFSSQYKEKRGTSPSKVRKGIDA